MFQAVFQPFYRPAHDPRRDAQGHHIGKDRLLHAITTARMGRRFQTQAVAGHI